jgi:hypothetical protein
MSLHLKSLPHLVIVLAAGWDTSAHEISTHRKLTQAAIDYLISTDGPKFECGAKKLEKLLAGAEAEDDFFRPKATFFPLGRFYFHFYGASGPLSGLGQHATCTSPEWGLVTGLPCNASNSVNIPGILKPVALTSVNTHTWSAALDHAMDADDQGLIELGYVIHLLEDLTSPAHTRNDPHPCAKGIFFCDPFEKVNGKADVVIGMPGSGTLLDGLPDPATFSTPEQFFDGLGNFTRRSFFSYQTAFSSSQPGPTIVTNEDSTYFYGPCLSGSDPACMGGFRKIARRNRMAKLANDRTKAILDETIVREQFAELSPITVQYVAALIKLYYKLAQPKLCARTVGVGIEGDGTGTVVLQPGNFSCSGGAQVCTTSVDDGTQIGLTASADSSSTFKYWTCQIPGGPVPIPFPPLNPLQMTITSDITCSAHFGLKPQAAISTLKCTQTTPPREDTQAIVEATGTASSEPNISVQIGATASSQFYSLIDLTRLEFNCGVWTLTDAEVGLCSRMPNQPASTTWTVKTKTRVTAKVINPPPLDGNAAVLYFDNHRAVGLTSESVGCTVQ